MDGTQVNSLYDILDTALGNQADGGAATPSGFASYFTIGGGYTVTQID